MAKIKTLNGASKSAAAIACGYSRLTSDAKTLADTSGFLSALAAAQGFEFGGNGQGRVRELTGIIKSAQNGTVTVAKGYLSAIEPPEGATYQVSTDMEAGTLTLTLIEQE